MPHTLVHPVTRSPLWHDTAHSLTDGTHRVPVVSGIPFLRQGRDRLLQTLLSALDRGDTTQALILALQDQDDWAPLPPPDAAALRDLVTGNQSFRDAMTALNFGPVAHYFAHRWSAPTFLSALGLLAAYAPLDRPLIDLACGTGQVLREVALRGGTAIGVDQVFAKLWLGQRYLGLDDLVCADAETLPFGPADAPRTILCHDALYFFHDAAKSTVIARMTDAAGPNGTVLLGHCHVRDHPHAGDRAHPLTVADWQSLMPGATCHDDAALTQWFLSRGDTPLTAHDGRPVAAVSLASGTRLARPVPFWDPVGPLVENPLLVRSVGGLRPDWPLPAFAEEYADAGYLAVPDAAVERARSRADRFARRTLLPLPERW